MATQQSVRYINARRALDNLFRNGPRSRAELSRSLGMTRSSTGAIIADLEEAGLVALETAPADNRPARTGRPGLSAAIAPAGASFVGAEIGVDRLSVVMTDLAANILDYRCAPFDTPRHHPEETVAALVSLIREVRDAAVGAGPLRGICVCLPALLRTDGTVINGLLLNWQEVPLRAMLTRHFDDRIPIAIENDANAFAFAETYGHPDERRHAHAFYLIEVGVGGGLVLGGEIYRGGNGLAGELGQTLIGGQGFGPEGRVRPGHVESYVGRDALLARWRTKGGPVSGTLEQFLNALAVSDEIALEAARDWGRKLAEGLVQVTAVINPDSIVLGGSVSPVFSYVANLVQDGLRRELLAGYPAPVVSLSRLGLEGPALGAAHLVHQRLFRIETEAFFGARPEDLGLSLYAEVVV